MEAINLAAFAADFRLVARAGGQVLRAGAVSLWDGFLYADSLSALVILLTASVALVCAVYAVGYLREDERSGALDEESGSSEPLAKLRKYYTLTPLFVFSMLLVAVANNLGVMWVAIEADHAGLGLPGHLLRQGHLARSRLEIRHHRRRRPVDGAVRHRRSPTTAGHKLPGTDSAGRLELVRAGRPRGATGQDHHAAGVHPGAARLRHQGRPRADAHLEAGRLQRSAGALGRDPFDRHAELRALRAGPLLRPHQPLPGRRFPAACCCCSACLSMGISVPFVLVQKNFRRLLAYSHHRPRRHHGDGPGRRRQARRAGPDAAHDVSHRRQIAAVPVRRQCLSALQDRPVRQDQGRRDPRDAADRARCS